MVCDDSIRRRKRVATVSTRLANAAKRRPRDNGKITIRFLGWSNHGEYG
jgi:hypothetical protein